MGNIFSLISQNWIGLVIGLVVAILLCFVLGFTLLREHKLISTILSIILVIAFSFAGMCIQDLVSPKNEAGITNPDILDTTIDRLDPEKYTDINTYGGFTRTYIKENKDKFDVCDTRYSSINMVEYKDVVVFYYDVKVDGMVYTANMIMNKAKNGLVFDGCFNLIFEKVYSGFLGTKSYNAPTNEDIEKAKNSITLTEMWRGDNFSTLDHEVSPDDGYNWPFQPQVLPSYYAESHPSNLFALQQAHFGQTYLAYGNEQKQVRKLASQLCYEVRNDNFQNLGQLSVMLDYMNEDGEYGKSYWMNTIYNDIYRAVKNQNHLKNIVDVTQHFYYSELQKDGTYKPFNCDTLLNVTYTKHLDQNCFKTNSEDKKYKDKIDKILVSDDDIILPAYSSTLLRLENINNTVLTGFDITKAPVTISFISRSTSTNYTYSFDTESELKNGLYALLPIGDYDVTIESPILNVNGRDEYTILGNAQVINLPFTYEYNTVLLNIKLQQISNLDLRELDLEVNPVILTFNNGTSSYNFVYDSVEKLKEIVTKRIPIGKYNYSIVSNELSFEKTSGTIEIDANNNYFLIYYDYKTNIEYVLNCVKTENNSSSGYALLFDLSIFSEVDYVTIFLKDKETNMTLMNELVENHYITSESLKDMYVQLNITLKNGEQIVTNIYDFEVGDLSTSNINIYFEIKAL